jgi:voltage-gated potassium channel Kch
MATKRGGQTDPIFLHDLDKAGRRRVLIFAVARLVAFTVVILALYFIIPIGGFNDANPSAAWIRLAFIILVFLATMTLQLHLILTAHIPKVRAAAAVFESVLMFLCLFSLLYTSMSVTDILSFSEPLDRTDALYFTTSTFATVGFGDITPVTRLARAVVSVQMIADLGALILIAKVTFFAAGRRLGREP